ncbi:MAG: hypothetical protein MHM6MM_001197 [Cercozoa sp. M6MM]
MTDIEQFCGLISVDANRRENNGNEVEWQFRCPIKNDIMTKFASKKMRSTGAAVFCGTCERQVFLARTGKATRAIAAAGHCVAYSPASPGSERSATFAGDETVECFLSVLLQREVPISPVTLRKVAVHDAFEYHRLQELDAARLHVLKRKGFLSGNFVLFMSAPVLRKESHDPQKVELLQQLRVLSESGPIIVVLTDVVDIQDRDVLMETLRDHAVTPELYCLQWSAGDPEQVQFLADSIKQTFLPSVGLVAPGLV